MRFLPWGIALVLGALLAWLLLREPAPGGESGAPLAPEPPWTAADATEPTLGPGPDVGPARAEPLTGPAAVVGRVLDVDGRPAVGVTVHLLRPPIPILAGAREIEEQFARGARGAHMGELLARTTTGDGGRFRIPGLAPATRYAIRAVPPAPRVGTCTGFSTSEPRHPFLELRLLPGCELRGRVVGAEDTGLLACVSAHVPADEPSFEDRDDAWWTFEVATDAEGGFRLPAVPQGRLHVGARVPGGASIDCVEIQVPSDGSIEIHLESGEGCALAGRVTSTAGEPIAKAELLVGLAPAGSTAWLLRRAVSQRDGSYEVRDLPAGKIDSILARASGYVSVQTSPAGLALESAGAERRQDVVLSRGARVEGHVRSEAGEALADVVVAAWCGEPLPEAWARATSDDLGFYRLVGVPTLPLVLGVESDTWHVPSPLDPDFRDLFKPPGVHVPAAAEGDVVTRDLVLRHGVRVEGRVVDEAGRPAAGVLVTAHRTEGGFVELCGPSKPTCVTDAEGRFEFEGLVPAADWRFEASGDGTHTRLTAPVAVDKGNPPRDLELRLLPTAAIRGRTVDAQGRPVAGACVEIDGSSRGRVTGEDGAFELLGLPAGTHELSARVGFSMVDRPDPVPVELAPGEDRRGLELEILGTLSITGRVTDEAGAAQPDVRIRLHWLDGRALVSESDWTDAQGCYAFRGLRPGRYRPQVRGQLLDLEIEAGRDDVHLVVPRVDGWTLEGVVRGPDGAPVAKADVEVTALEGEGADFHGTTRVAAGRFLIEVPDACRAVSVVVDDAEGPSGARLGTQRFEREGVGPGDGPLRIDLQRGLVVAGRVVDSEGEGVAGVEVRPAYAWRVAPATTDAQGAFRLVGFEAGRVRLEVRPTGGWARPEDPEVEAGDEEVRIVLEPALVLDGRVLGPDARPIEGARVLVLGTGGAASWLRFGHRLTEDFREARTEADGAFRVEGLAHRAYEVLVLGPEVAGDADWAVHMSRQVHPGGDALTVRLVHGAPLVVEVFGPDGAPVAGAEVLATPSDADGVGELELEPVAPGSPRYRSVPVPPGRYRIEAQGTGRAGSGTVTIEAPAPCTPIDLARAWVIEGVLRGTHPEGFEVAFYRMREHVGDVERTASAGRFVLQVESEEAGTLIARRDDDVRYALLEDVTPGGGPYDLVLARGLEITGRVPSPGRSVVRIEGPFGNVVRVKTQDDGAFRVAGLPPGSYELRCWKLHGGKHTFFRAAGVEAGTRDVILTARN